MGSALQAQHQSTETMTSLNSKLQLALLNRKKSRNLLQKGFTLIELLIVVVILGVLSAIAVPAFLNQQDKAKANAMNTEIMSLLRACAALQVTGDTANASPLPTDGAATSPADLYVASGSTGTLGASSGTKYCPDKGDVTLTGVKAGNYASVSKVAIAKLTAGGVQLDTKAE